MDQTISGLIAYPAEPREIGECIQSALQKLQRDNRFSDLKSWEESDIPGRFIANEVLHSIERGSLFAADITRLNFNVVFEIGYAIGCNRRAFLVRNDLIVPDVDRIRQVGIFDTLGYSSYKDSGSLTKLISGLTDLNPLQFDKAATIGKAPVYVLLPSIKGDSITHMISRIKKARLFYRSFDPEEHGRLSAPEAIENVARSHGVIVPLLPTHYNGAEVHNYRAAFVAGLTQGMGKLLLLLQNGNDPVPLDYRDLVDSYKSPRQMGDHIADFAVKVFESLQSSREAIATEPSSLLSRLTLGASSAENEFQELGNYYLETDEFRRSLRGEIQVVIGRKGSGKTALFFQLRDRLRSDRKKVVLDLKPEGFQLLKFKEQVLDHLEHGTQEHTVTAFWEYLLLLEICHKLLDNDRSYHLRDHTLYEPYRRLESIYDTDKYISEGDFAERMLVLTRTIGQDFHAAFAEAPERLRLTGERITEFIYKHDINDLRTELVSYLQHKDALWILFDNLDKGWPPHGVTPQDALSLRCLIDAIQKLERSFRKESIPTKGILFIRNDVYENLVDIMPDRGKIAHALVDWTDESLLLELLRKRFIYSGDDRDLPFDRIWSGICVSHVRGEETSHYMVERCLMRPRSLIDFIRFCRSHAINLHHTRIEVEDIDNAEEQYSTQLVNDIGYEIQDIFPTAKDVLYEFASCPPDLNQQSVADILSRISPDVAIQDKVFEILLWYAVLGFRREDGDPIYIYSVRYDMKRLKALLHKTASENVTYSINPAFWRGLDITFV